MNLRKMIQSEEMIQHLEDELLDVDSEFRFKCNQCGRCCINQDTIILNPVDIFNIAKKKGMTTLEVVEAYTEVYIGPSSRIPIVHLLPNGPNGACPLLENGLCSVHDCKPLVCALFPLGRVAITRKDEQPHERQEPLVKYSFNGCPFGSGEDVNTVRSWLAKFGISEHDELNLLWDKLRLNLSQMVMRMEAANISQAGLERFWGTIYHLLYIHYDTSQEFIPQFQATADMLINLGAQFMKLPLPSSQED